MKWRKEKDVTEMLDEHLKKKYEQQRTVLHQKKRAELYYIEKEDLPRDAVVIPRKNVKSFFLGIATMILVLAIVGGALAVFNTGVAIDMGSQKITSLATPTVSTDAATKGYVDGLAEHTQSQVFTSSGTFTVPTGVTMVWVTMTGGGGGGTGGGSNCFGGGGGSGESVISFPVAVTAGVGYPVTVGGAGTAGTTAGTVGNPGGNGGDSAFNGITAHGGYGGTGCLSGSYSGNGGNGGGPLGGAGAVANTNVAGNAVSFNYGMGGAGGGAPNEQAGNYGSNSISIMPANSGGITGAPGLYGTSYGAGGKPGNLGGSGTAGNAGVVIIQWVG